jgi:hypothetical protein
MIDDGYLTAEDHLGVRVYVDVKLRSTYYAGAVTVIARCLAVRDDTLQYFSSHAKFGGPVVNLRPVVVIRLLEDKRQAVVVRNIGTTYITVLVVEHPPASCLKRVKTGDLRKLEELA